MTEIVLVWFFKAGLFCMINSWILILSVSEWKERRKEKEIQRIRYLGFWFGTASTAASGQLFPSDDVGRRLGRHLGLGRLHLCSLRVLEWPESIQRLGAESGLLRATPSFTKMLKIAFRVFDQSKKMLLKMCFNLKSLNILFKICSTKYMSK